jgi:uncharacterized membrane protein SirB2
MITKIVFLVMFVVLARLAVDTFRRGSFGFRKIEYGFEIAMVSFFIAMVMFGAVDAIGVLAVFCFEIFKKLEEKWS